MRQGREKTDADGERVEGERTGRQYTDNTTTKNDQRRSAKRIGHPENGTGRRGRGGGGDTGYTLTLEDLRLWEVYRDWIDANPGTHLDGGIGNNGV